MTRSRPVEFEFVAHDDPELLARMGEVAATGTGWINVDPVIDEEHQPPAPGPFAFLGGSTHQVPTVTWMPGKHFPDGTTRSTTVGLQHAAGPHLAWKLNDLGLPLPDGWRSPRTIPVVDWSPRSRPRRPPCEHRLAAPAGVGRVHRPHHRTLGGVGPRRSTLRTGAALAQRTRGGLGSGPSVTAIGGRHRRDQ